MPGVFWMNAPTILTSFLILTLEGKVPPMSDILCVTKLTLSHVSVFMDFSCVVEVLFTHRFTHFFPLGVFPQEIDVLLFTTLTILGLRPN